MPSDPDNSADALNAQEVAKNETVTVEPESEFHVIVVKVEAMLFRLAAVEETLSKIVPHIGPLAVIMPIADEVAALVESLKRGRNNLGS